MELPYLKFFGLKEEPFSTVPSPRYFFLTSVHSTALEKAAYVVGAKKGLSVVFGDTGTGKSSLARLLHQKFLDSGFFSSLLTNPSSPTPNCLLRTIAQELGTPRTSKSFKGMLDLFKEHLWEKAATEGKTVTGPTLLLKSATWRPAAFSIRSERLRPSTAACCPRFTDSSGCSQHRCCVPPSAREKTGWTSVECFAKKRSCFATSPAWESPTPAFWDRFFC